jgi:hypothetical protein
MQSDPGSHVTGQSEDVGRALLTERLVVIFAVDAFSSSFLGGRVY